MDLEQYRWRDYVIRSDWWIGERAVTLFALTVLVAASLIEEPIACDYHEIGQDMNGRGRSFDVTAHRDPLRQERPRGSALAGAAAPEPTLEPAATKLADTLR